MRAKDDSDKVEVCFRSLAKLIRAKPADLSEIAVETATVNHVVYALLPTLCGGGGGGGGGGAFSGLV